MRSAGQFNTLSVAGGLASQQLRDDLATLRLVQLVGDSLLEQEHGRLLQHAVTAATDVIATTTEHRRLRPKEVIYSMLEGA